MGYDIIGNFHVVDRHFFISRCFHGSLLWPPVCHGPWRTHGRWTGTGAWGGFDVPFIKQFCDGDLFGIVICDPFKWLESWPPTIGDRSLGHGGRITLSQGNPGNPGNPDKESEPPVAMAYPNRSSHHAPGGTGIRLHMLSKEKSSPEV